MVTSGLQRQLSALCGWLWFGVGSYLVANGMPADRIIVDAVAYSTLDNAVNSKALLSAGGRPPPEELVVVTHDWHMERAKMLFEVRQGCCT